MAAPMSVAALVAVEGMKCLHFETDKTPQWRTGPAAPPPSHYASLVEIGALAPVANSILHRFCIGATHPGLMP
jgi:hypothetical protein